MWRLHRVFFLGKRQPNTILAENLFLEKADRARPFLWRNEARSNISEEQPQPQRNPNSDRGFLNKEIHYQISPFQKKSRPPRTSKIRRQKSATYLLLSPFLSLCIVHLNGSLAFLQRLSLLSNQGFFSKSEGVEKCFFFFFSSSPLYSDGGALCTHFLSHNEDCEFLDTSFFLNIRSGGGSTAWQG